MSLLVALDSSSTLLVAPPRPLAPSPTAPVEFSLDVRRRMSPTCAPISFLLPPRPAANAGLRTVAFPLVLFRQMASVRIRRGQCIFLLLLLHSHDGEMSTSRPLGAQGRLVAQCARCTHRPHRSAHCSTNLPPSSLREKELARLRFKKNREIALCLVIGLALSPFCAPFWLLLRLRG